MKKTAMVETVEILGHGNMTTAHMIARVTGYTPQHINRCLKHLFGQGKVAYAVVEHRGRAKQKRLWVAMKDVNKFEHQYVIVEPEFTQEELGI